jgi:hypothetical protein
MQRFKIEQKDASASRFHPPDAVFAAKKPNFAKEHGDPG